MIMTDIEANLNLQISHSLMVVVVCSRWLHVHHVDEHGQVMRIVEYVVGHNVDHGYTFHCYSVESTIKQEMHINREVWFEQTCSLIGWWLGEFWTFDGETSSFDLEKISFLGTIPIRIEPVIFFIWKCLSLTLQSNIFTEICTSILFSLFFSDLYDRSKINKAKCTP